jgi:hypothetical protein
MAHQITFNTTRSRNCQYPNGMQKCYETSGWENREEYL